jgi:3-demethoxyubiquinol 3-hydroxylase
MLSFIDECIIKFDKVLKAAYPAWPTTTHIANPADNEAEMALTIVEKHQSQSMMRVNLAGEVAAQGLYRGQMLLANSPELKQELNAAAEEEWAHYVWCLDRLKELDDSPSLFNPVWYCGAFVLGMLASMISDKTSLGFVIATEEQVGQHLASHLWMLPRQDFKSRAIVRQMYQDELGHAEMAEHRGGERLPLMVQYMMHLAAQVMIQTSGLI